MQIWVAAMKEHPAVKSGEVELTVVDGNYNALTQQNQFDTMITQKYDAIIFAPIDVDAGAAAVEAAHKAGIPVIGSNTRVNSDLLTSYIGSDDTKSGYMEAKIVLDKMGCKGNVVVIEGPDRPVRTDPAARGQPEGAGRVPLTSRCWRCRPPTGAGPRRRR